MVVGGELFLCPLWELAYAWMSLDLLDSFGR